MLGMTTGTGRGMACLLTSATSAAHEATQGSTTPSEAMRHHDACVGRAGGAKVRYMMNPTPAIRWLVGFVCFRKENYSRETKSHLPSLYFCKSTKLGTTQSAMGWHPLLAREHARRVGGA